MLSGSFTLRKYSWQCFWAHMGHQELNLGLSWIIWVQNKHLYHCAITLAPTLVFIFWGQHLAVLMVYYALCSGNHSWQSTMNHMQCQSVCAKQTSYPLSYLSVWPRLHHWWEDKATFLGWKKVSKRIDTAEVVEADIFLYFIKIVRGDLIGFYLGCFV